MYTERKCLLSLIEDEAFYSQMKDRILPLTSLEQMCRTFFPVGDKDYTVGQPQYTLLKKKKRNMQTGEIIIQYDRMISKPNN